MIKALIDNNPVDLMNNLRQQTLDNPKKTLEIISLLEKSKRYKNDFDFSLVVEVQKISALTFIGEHAKYSKKINSVYKKVTQTKDVDIYLDSCARLGTAYYEIGNLEKSIKIFSDIFEYEKKHNIVSERSAIACTNIGLLYFAYNKEKESQLYHQMASDIMESIIDLNTASPTQIGTYISIVSHLISMASNRKDILFVEENLARIKDIDKSNMPKNIILDYKESLLRYYSIIRDIDNFYRNIDLFIEMRYEQGDYSRVLVFLLNIYNINKEFIEETDGLDDEFFNFVIEHLQVIKERAVYSDLRAMYLLVLDYAIRSNNDDLMFEYYSKLNKLQELSLIEDGIKKSQSLDMFIELTNEEQNEKKILEKNLEISILNEEDKRISEELKTLYDRLRLSSAIGQKIISADSLYDIQKSVHEELDALIRIDSIALFTLIADDKIMTSYVYDRGEYDYNILIDINDKLSFCAKVFRDGQPFITNNLHEDELFIEKTKGEDEEQIDSYSHSAVYYPVIKMGEVIAVLSVQSIERNSYSKDDIELIKAISSYIAIATININRSKDLKKEINMLEGDERELRTLVEYNKKLNAIDALTGVRNRYSLSVHFPKLIKKAKAEEKNINVFIFDIDDFKIYNDSNGHPEGDKVLIDIANIINELFVSENSIFVRYGGEEFLALEIGTSSKEAKDKAELMRNLVEKLNIKYNDSIEKNLTISIGLSTYSHNNIKSKKRLIQEADDNLYKAKSLGKNCVVQTVIGDDLDD